jgi:predicted dehydrogenase
MDADGGSARAKTKLATQQERFADPYRAELDAFRTILRTGKVDSALTSLPDRLKVQQIGAAAKISARNGKP